MSDESRTVDTLGWIKVIQESIDTIARRDDLTREEESAVNDIETALDELRERALPRADERFRDIVARVDQAFRSWSADDTDSYMVGEWLDTVGVDECAVADALAENGIKPLPVLKPDTD